MDHGMGLLGSTVMSREEFEARKAELRRKREIERRVRHRQAFLSGCLFNEYRIHAYIYNMKVPFRKS